MSATKYKLASIYKGIYLSKNKTTGDITKQIVRSNLVSIGDIRAKKKVTVSDLLTARNGIDLSGVTGSQTIENVNIGLDVSGYANFSDVSVNNLIAYNCITVPNLKVDKIDYVYQTKTICILQLCHPQLLAKIQMLLVLPHQC